MSWKQHSFRVDHFARRAKSRGFVTRSVFKLSAIHQKYDILQPGQSSLDLGAAPGGWMQYTWKRINTNDVNKNGFILGIDLSPIDLKSLFDENSNNKNSTKNNNSTSKHKKSTKKSVEIYDNIEVIQSNILNWDYASFFNEKLNDDTNTNNTNDSINNDNRYSSLKYGFDNIMSDMAPNISGISTLDHERSFELCYKTFELSLLLGKYNCNLILKAFQSVEMTMLLKEIKQYFEKVHVFKPQASRDRSKETYIVALGLKLKPSIMQSNYNSKSQKIIKIDINNCVESKKNDKRKENPACMTMVEYLKNLGYLDGLSVDGSPVIEPLIDVYGLSEDESKNVAEIETDNPSNVAMPCNTKDVGIHDSRKSTVTVNAESHAKNEKKRVVPVGGLLSELSREQQQL